MRELLSDPRGPDTTFRTWVHESVHARQPYVIGFRQEYARWRGYEEGLAEGLARSVVRDRAGMDPIEAAYRYYVAGYRGLARALGVNVEQLWRRLFQLPTGRARDRFADAVDELRRERAAVGLSVRQREKLYGVADTLFGSDRRDALPDEDSMMKLWEVALG
jgi:hypothetical protein